MQFKIFTPALYCSTILLSGCVVLPVPVEPKTTEGMDVGWTQAYIKPNVTTKERIVGRCGQPSAIWVEANLYIYNWTELKGRLLWAVVGYFDAAGGAEDISTRYMLLIQFDKYDRVQRFEMITRPWNKTYGGVLRDWVSHSTDKSSNESVGHTE